MKYIICMLKFDWTEAGYGFCIVEDKFHGSNTVSCYSSGGKTIGISFYMSSARFFDSVMDAKKFIDDYKMPINRSESNGYKIFEVDPNSYGYRINFIDFHAASHKAYVTKMSINGKHSIIEASTQLATGSKEKIIEYLNFLEKNREISEVIIDGRRINHMHILTTDFSQINHAPKTIKEVYCNLYPKRGRK